MKKSVTTGLVMLTVAMAGMAQAETKTVPSTGSAVAPAKVSKPALRVVAGATALSTVEKLDVTGMCGCPPPPAPTVKAKPGYGFGAKTEHYGPPGQGFTPEYSWRDARAAGRGTPKGNSLPPRAFK